MRGCMIDRRKVKGKGEDEKGRRERGGRKERRNEEKGRKIEIKQWKQYVTKRRYGEGERRKVWEKRRERKNERGGFFFSDSVSHWSAAPSRGRLVKYGLPFNCLHSDMWHILAIPHKIRRPRQFVLSFLLPSYFCRGSHKY